MHPMSARELRRPRFASVLLASPILPILFVQDLTEPESDWDRARSAAAAAEGERDSRSAYPQFSDEITDDAAADARRMAAAAKHARVRESLVYSAGERVNARKQLLRAQAQAERQVGLGAEATQRHDSMWQHTSDRDETWTQTMMRLSRSAAGRW